MSYCTHILDHITITGVPADDLALMPDVLYNAIAHEGGYGLPKLTPRGEELLNALRTLDTPHRWNTYWKQDPPPEIALEDFRFEVSGSELWLMGTDYIGGTRGNLDQQINWILAWLRHLYPDAKFSGQVEEWDDEQPGTAPTWYVVNGATVDIVATMVVPYEEKEQK